ncbi:MAG: 2-dehydropantoate 2-reductase [Candidatus Thermoplasmatota archaeon]|nr:2-dehydropantoate 2-reductase [Candidatus Thermoplasmatota archaeon]
MRFLIFGAGALGSLFGGLLSQRHEVMLVGRRVHMEAIRRNGLKIGGRTNLVVHPTAQEDIAEVESLDVVVLTVKAYDTEGALEALKPFWRKAAFLSLQNGLGNEDLLAERADRVLGGVTNQGVTFVAPGEVYHAGIGDTYIGPYRGTGLEEAAELVEAFSMCGIPSELSEDIRGELWLKTLVNACINPLTGLLEVKNGHILQSTFLTDVVREIVDEGLQVAALQGLHLDREEVLEKVWSIAEATADNISSMLQDLEKGRRTEIDSINGAIVERGREGGVSCPINSLLTNLVKALEEASPAI